MRLAELSQYESGRVDEAIKWHHKAAGADNKNPALPFLIGKAYAALGDLDMTLAYYGLARGIMQSDATGWQHAILMAEALAWLVSGRDDSDTMARERLAMSDIYDELRLEIELSLDSSTTRAQQLLSRIKDQNPECFAYDADHSEHAACPAVVYYLIEGLGEAETAQLRLENQFEGLNAISVFNRKVRGPDLLKDLSLLGRQEEALDLLEELVHSGWRGGDGNLRFDLYRNILFDDIREHPRFQAMVAVIESDMSEQLDNVREMQEKGELPTLNEVQDGLLIGSN
jgi:tetratricopeptide (TPR) repeat protein